MNCLITKASNQGEWFNIDYCILKIDDKLKGRIKKYIDFIKWSVKPTDAVGSVGCKRPLTLGENILTYGFW